MIINCSDLYIDDSTEIIIYYVDQRQIGWSLLHRWQRRCSKWFSQIDLGVASGDIHFGAKLWNC